MKKFLTFKKYQFYFIALIAAYFTLNSLIQRSENWQNYAKDLQSEGWSKKAAEKIAKVEFNILPIDQEYNAYIND